MAIGNNMANDNNDSSNNEKKQSNSNNMGNNEDNLALKQTISELENEIKNQSGLKSTVDLSFARIEFDSAGKILDANDNFANVLGYNSVKDFVGKHHSIFVDQAYKASPEYKKFWSDLATGITQAGQFKRITKDGKEIWIQAAYTPVKNSDGNVIKVIKIATDVTAQVHMQEEAKQAAEELKAQEEELRQNMEEMQATQEEMQRNGAAMKGVLNAIDSAYAYIEFDTTGNVLTANDNFLKTMGYTMDEIKGRHHRTFVDKEYAKSNEYSNFWVDLGNGKANNNQFKRYTKNGAIVWLQAVYSPVLDASGKVTKVIKIATNITEQKNEAINALGLKSTVDMSFAEIEFDTKGNILDANENFVKTLGYNSSKDIIGGHHSMFVDSNYKASSDYKKFWNDLGNGITQAGQFKRITKDGKEIWIQAAYTPVKDEEGNVVKVMELLLLSGQKS
jgi:methyl-accepting chemotaxis protein